MRTRDRIALLMLLSMLVVAAAPAHAGASADSGVITSRQATTHPMRYHVALPKGWTASRQWPVLVVIPDAGRDFKGDLARFARARGNRPYIVVAPEVMSCGGARTRTPDLYSYSAAEWQSLVHGDDFAFEDAGLAAVLADVRKQWHGEPRAYLTGWEAGGHTVWAQAFRHPERWLGVAPVTPNYQRRGMGVATFSHAPERASLPIQPFRCGVTTADNAQLIPVIDGQIAVALADARAHGFKPRPARVVPGVPHGPLPESVLAWCDSLRGR